MEDSPHILKIKSDWQLEIQLDGGALMLSANGIFDLNVNLWGKYGRVCLRSSGSIPTKFQELRPEFRMKGLSIKANLRQPSYG